MSIAPLYLVYKRDTNRTLLQITYNHSSARFRAHRFGRISHVDITRTEIDTTMHFSHAPLAK